MIRSIGVSTALIVLLSLVQSTWLGSIAILGVVPDLGLLVLIWVSYKNGLVEGPASGFIAGLLEDAISAAPLGFNAFLKTVIAWAVGLLHGSFYIDRIFLPILLGAGATILKALASLLLGLLFDNRVQVYDLLGSAIWIEAAYNGLLAPFVFLLLSTMRKLLVTEASRE